MKLWQRLKSAAIVAWYGAYEAARWSPDRSYIPPVILEPHEDLAGATRLDLIAKCQHLERNSNELNILADVWEQYTAGANGIQCSPASSDEQWNEKRKASWAAWCKTCDLNGLNLGQALSLASRRWFVDGESWVHKTARPSTDLPGRFEPAIQLIEAHRIRTPTDRAKDEGKTIFDGIAVDPQGTKQVAFVKQPGDVESFKPIKFSNLIQLWEPHRPGMAHGIPIATPVINTLIDLRNLKSLEMLSAKDAASTSKVITTESGEVPVDTLRAARVTGSRIDSQGNSVSEDRIEHYRQVLGAKTVALKKGEAMAQYASTRPTDATQAHWRILLSDICSGTGISMLLAFPNAIDRIQGTLVRAELERAALFFRARASVTIAIVREIYLWHLDYDVSNNPLLKDKPGNWREVNIQPPRAPNVDVGRNSAAMLAELEAGATNYDLIYGPLGLDAREQLRKSAQFAKYIRELATEFGVEPGEIAKHTGDAAIAASKVASPLQNA